jgi:hypothetical protein
MTRHKHIPFAPASARPARLRQSILQKAFTGKLLTADNADNTDGKRKISAPSA